MKIHGFNKLTLLDYPEHLAAVLFLGGCNFRCPFCHNSGLVLAPEKEPVISKEEIFQVLRKRKGILDGVCITGGEPTLDPELPDLLWEIKQIGYATKLDTNGTKPELVKHLIADGLVDYVAMDIKNSLGKYPMTTGVSQPDLEAICQTVEELKKGTIEYEFRTTIVWELHEREDFIQIGKWLKGSRKYFLQSYQESEQVIRPGFHSYSEEECREFQKLLLEYIPEVGLRGV